MKNVSRSNSSKFPSCLRPVVDLDAMPVLDPPKHHSSVSHHHHPHPKPTCHSLFIKAFSIQTRRNTRSTRPPGRHASKRRSSSGGVRTALNQAAKASNIPAETKEEPPSSCWSPASSESEDSSHSVKPDEKGTIREDDKAEEEKKSECLGIFMVVLSLTLTVTVGKYWGVFFTSTWLYLYLLSLVKSCKREAQIVDKIIKEDKALLRCNKYHKGAFNF